jgi:hypothetical protein
LIFAFYCTICVRNNFSYIRHEENGFSFILPALVVLRGHLGLKDALRAGYVSRQLVFIVILDSVCLDGLGA